MMDAATPRRRWGAALGLLSVVCAAAWEGCLALSAPGRVPSDRDWREAAAVVRAGFAPSDLIVVAPPWADPLLRRELGDLMPLAMVGRPDAGRWARIWELSLRGARAPEAAGLPVEARSRHGLVTLTRYRKPAVAVTCDLVEQFLTARVSQAPLGTEGPETPCPWSGPPPGQPPARGESGAFRCRGSRVERRVMEIDYQPRYGVVVPAEPGLRTIVEYAQVPAAAWEGAELVLWLGLHDYYARKTESGPVEVVVQLGARRVARSVPPEGWHRLALRPEGAGAASPVRVEVSARDARARYLGFAAEVRR